MFTQYYTKVYDKIASHVADICCWLQCLYAKEVIYFKVEDPGDSITYMSNEFIVVNYQWLTTRLGHFNLNK